MTCDDEQAKEEKGRSPDECTGEQIRKCHGEVQHPCTTSYKDKGLKPGRESCVEAEGTPERATHLPEWFVPVAEDVFNYCRPDQGLWVDLGSGSGGLGLALARGSCSTVVFVDSSAKALSDALENAKQSGLAGRARAVAGRAESLPLASGSVNLVTSRGSIFFWNDPPRGLREVYRILRPGARALVGGGFGSSYPEWALEEFRRRRDKHIRAQGRKALHDWYEVRRPEWLAAQAQAAGLGEFLVKPVPPGFWLLVEKGTG